MFVIFTAPKALSLARIKKESTLKTLFIDLKLISSTEASFKKTTNDLWIVRLHGADRAGLVHKVTQCLANYGFNITDLSTHRTNTGRVPGYILFIEGEPVKASTKKLSIALNNLAVTLGTRISFSPVSIARL